MGRGWPGPVCVDERYSTEIDNRHWYKSQNSAGSSGPGQKFGFEPMPVEHKTIWFYLLFFARVVVTLLIFLAKNFEPSHAVGSLEYR